MKVHPSAISGFTNTIQYELGRSGYSERTLQLICKHILGRKSNAHSVDVLDVGAGSGKLLRGIQSLLPATMQCMAVEPVKSMRNEFQKQSPHVPVLNNTAACIDLPSNSVSNIVIGQAFHWFATTSVLNEVRFYTQI